MQTLEVISPLRSVPLHETPPLCGVHPSGNVCTADDRSYQLSKHKEAHVMLISGSSPNFQILWHLLSHQSLVIWLLLVPPVPPATEWVVLYGVVTHVRAFLVHANAPSLSFTSGWLQKHISRWHLPMRPREIRYNFPLCRLSSLSSRLIHLMAPITSTPGPQSISFNRWVVLVANRWALSRGRYFPREKPSDVW